MRAALLGLILVGCALRPVPPNDVVGTVRSADGAPLAGATVELRSRFFAPLCCSDQAILQLTRTGPDGRYRFVMGGDRDFHFPAESRDYVVVALQHGYKSSESRPSEDVSKPIDLVLTPFQSKYDTTEADCFELCIGVRSDCRRAAEFHFGDKTRCDAWMRDPY